MASSPQKPGLRPLLPTDVAVAAAIFVASVSELTSDDYTELQQQAWPRQSRTRKRWQNVWPVS